MSSRAMYDILYYADIADIVDSRIFADLRVRRSQCVVER